MFSTFMGTGTQPSAGSMKWRIASVRGEAESSRFRNDSASTGLYRFRVDPVGGGLTRNRYDPLLSGVIRPVRAAVGDSKLAVMQ